MAKTRLQLDAELNRGKKVYANTLDVFKRTWQAEGIKGIQRGLAPAVSLCRFTRFGQFTELHAAFLVCIPGTRIRSFQYAWTNFHVHSCSTLKILLNGCRLGEHSQLQAAWLRV